MTDEVQEVDRRRSLSSCLMWGGLAAGYGLGAFHFLKYLVPMGEEIQYRELFVGPVDQLKIGAGQGGPLRSGAQLDEWAVRGRGQGTQETLRRVLRHAPAGRGQRAGKGGMP